MRYYVVSKDELWHYGTPGMRWGVRNGPPYPLNSKTAAHSVYEQANKRIGKISSDVIGCAKRSNSKMYGLEHKLKTEQSIKRKIEKEVIEKNCSVGEAAGSIKDAIRFTTISSEKDFVNNYEQFKSKMLDKGYSEIRCKNYFMQFKEGKVKHKSVQSNFQTKDGYIFEVQFQTPSSQNVKDKKVPLYEEARDVRTSSARRSEIEKQMESMANGIADPMGIERIRSH